MEKAVFFFDGALVTSGHRNPAWGTSDFTLIGLPDKANPGAWSELYEDKIARAKIEADRYEKIAEGIRKAKAEALRNRYTLQVYEQTNNLQNYPVRLILALNDYDTAKDETARRDAWRRSPRSVITSMSCGQTWSRSIPKPVSCSSPKVLFPI